MRLQKNKIYAFLWKAVCFTINLKKKQIMAHKSMPAIPDKTMLNNLTLDIVKWMDYYPHSLKTLSNLIYHLNNMGYKDIPQWLKDELIVHDTNKIADPTLRATLVYKSMYHSLK